MHRVLIFVRRYFLPLAIVFGVLALLSAYELGQTSVYRAHPELTSVEQANAILAKVGTLIQLPNEQPTMATVKDAASVKQGQPFLANVQNGDVLIVYPKTGEAILYRPSSNKLINVGPIDNSVPAASKQSALQVPVTATSTDDATTTKSKK